MSSDRLEQQPPGTACGVGVPDLTVDVISPGDRHAEVEEKALVG